MSKFFHSDNRLLYTNEQISAESIDEKRIFSLFADNLREIRTYCGLSLIELSRFLDIPNQTISSYENKTHIPSMIQAIKIAAYFSLTVEEFVLCGLDGYPYDITELYERRKKGL